MLVGPEATSCKCPAVILKKKKVICKNKPPKSYLQPNLSSNLSTAFHKE